MIGLKFRGRPPIKLAESVKDIVSLENEYARMIMDRSVKIDEDTIAAIMGQSLMTWVGRNPAPALDSDGNFQGTDLDLLSFLMPMADRGAVIEISHYHNRRQIVRRANERKIGSNQFGVLTRLVSHKNVLSFSVGIHDETIVRRDSQTGRERIGAPRNYMIIDCDGHWYEGWDRIVWDPSAEENQFLTEKDLWSGNSVVFKYYVHPNRWQSVFGAPYLLQKMLIERLNDEAQFYGAEAARLEAMGISYPPGLGEGKFFSTPPEHQGETMPIKINTIEMVLDIPEFFGSYAPVSKNSNGLAGASNHAKRLIYTVRPFVQFCVRANEAAYFKFGQSKVAHWMHDRQWVSGWRTPNGRIAWNLMPLSNDMALRYRIKTITQQVSAE